MLTVTVAGFLIGALLLIGQLYTLHLIKTSPDSTTRIYLFPELDLELTEYIEEPVENKYVSRFWEVLERILYP